MDAPPFCPYKECQNHTSPPDHRWWRHDGFHSTKAFGLVQRFQCLACGRTFSTQTFSLDFYSKRPFDYPRLEELNASSMSVRALARAFHCSPASIINRTDRLARQALATHSSLLPLAQRYESISIDGFVSFDRSQFFPNNLTISIASESRFVLAFTHASLRRSGAMQPRQKQLRDDLYRGLLFEPRALERSFSDLLDELERHRPPSPKHPLVIVTDEKLEYDRALFSHRLFRNQDEEHRVAHLKVNSSLPRTFLNPLFPSNYLDREIRKDQAAHRRESTCFGRTVANGLSRMACYLCWHNYRKRYLIKRPERESQTHGEMAGIEAGTIARLRKEMFTRRAFLSRTNLDGVAEKMWKKAFPSPIAPRPAYLPAFALD